jgi:hypothetical protein
MGARTYLAALDIGRRGGRQPRVFGRSERRGGIAAFDRLVWQVMTREPYATARRVFRIVEWSFTREDLAELMDRLAPHEPELRLAA